MGNAGQVNYAASNAGLIGMPKALARTIARTAVFAVMLAMLMPIVSAAQETAILPDDVTPSSAAPEPAMSPEPAASPVLPSPSPTPRARATPV